ncbi:MULTISPECIES: DUF721 domain-containing protein [Candidatus Ichthyocystis]|uniref:DUF721 domain-containing protein n=1 Tax=Candidatus Ichthyocystis TaxID=2929841 RepID=UPI00159EBF09|nr:DUF721 domain-containing protein [Candidatus Ichthyocystis sparus]
MSVLGKKIGDAIELPLGSLLSDINLTLSVRAIYSQLPPPYPAKNSRVVVLRNGKLVIRADDSSVATRLRFVQDSLIKTLKEHGITVEEIKILSQPAS